MHCRHHEKTFEQAAMTVYRQKSFFNKWKNKSIKTETRGSHSKHNGRTGSHHNVRASNMRANTVNIPRIRFSAVKHIRSSPGLGHRGESQPRSSGYREDVSTNEPPRLQVHLAPDPSYSASTVVYPPSYIDTAVQTDDWEFLPSPQGLRRRIRSSTSSDRSGGFLTPSTSPRPNGRRIGMSEGPSRAVNAFSLAPAHYMECTETDSLLPGNRNVLSLSDRSLATKSTVLTPVSPFTPGSDRSPLLSSNDDHFAYESTSEESLSNTCDDDDEGLDDLEELLSGVYSGSYTGSFSSDIAGPEQRRTSCDANGKFKRNNGRTDNKKRGSKDHNASSLERLPHVLVLESPKEPVSRDLSLRCVKSAPSLTEEDPVIPLSPPLPDSPTSPHTLPQSFYNYEPPDERSNSGTGKSQRTSNNKTECESCQPSTSGIKRSHSHPSGSTDTSKSKDKVSVEDISLNGMTLLDDEAESVSKFQDFLRSKGLKQDLTSIQSSDV